MDQVHICAVCQHALDIVTSEEGVTFIHASQDPDDHEVIPVKPGPEWRGRCDLCSTPGPEYVLPAHDFRVPGQDLAMSGGGWAVCSECAPLIESNQWNAVARRTVAFYVAKHVSDLGQPGVPSVEDYSATVRALHRKLRDNITGSIRRIGEGE